jgi:hypothetical protein
VTGNVKLSGRLIAMNRDGEQCGITVYSEQQNAHLLDDLWIYV